MTDVVANLPGSVGGGATYKYNPRADKLTDVHREQPGPGKSVEVVNYSNNLVFVDFAGVSQPTSQWDLIVPPWMGRVQAYTGEGLITTNVVGQNKPIGTYDNIRVSVSDVELEPVYYSLPQIQSVADGGKFYTSSNLITLAASGIWLNTAIILPPSLLGVAFKNMGTPGTDPAILCEISGDGTWNNLTPTSGYSDPSATGIYLQAGDSISVPIQVPNVTGNVRIRNASTTAQAFAEAVFWGY